ncbi:TetR/AcrR family transcriptional regulator [Sutterella sp.]|uniref:TetR/AcrR family transcriptional regulator n=1 Tax=Sutterella sp. TaxID=1981025 RepID=UPI0026E1131C|nr:TetR/AcrR family transcriptional regulator [Sutterella sp.]MDO5531470.1 TetR/AcrR family transcriptional regulator [Sutterella sp.]
MSKDRKKSEGKPPESPAEENRRDSREAILDAAEARFANSGIDGVAMREIAEDVGITKAALYYHFTSKDELWFAVCERLSADRMDRLRAAAAECPDAVARLRCVISHLVDAFFENHHLSLIIHRMLLDPDEERARRVALIAWKDTFEILYGLANELGIRGNRQHWVTIVAGMFLVPFEARGLLASFPGAGDGPFTPETLKESIFAVLLPGGKPAGAV